LWCVCCEGLVESNIAILWCVCCEGFVESNISIFWCVCCEGLVEINIRIFGSDCCEGVVQRYVSIFCMAIKICGPSDPSNCNYMHFARSIYIFLCITYVSSVLNNVNFTVVSY
jgi:hypothetical protein